MAENSAYLGIDLDSTDNDDFTVLMKCMFMKKNYPLASTLISFGASVDFKNHNGLSANDLTNFHDGFKLADTSTKESTVKGAV